ncbi:MAG: hypothetical protein WAN46_16035 [Gammaproteobacteria bacterium]|jgi:hypothetical protein
MTSSVASSLVKTLSQGGHHFRLADFTVRVVVDGVELEQREKRSRASPPGGSSGSRLLAKGLILLSVDVPIAIGIVNRERGGRRIGALR